MWWTKSCRQCLWCCPAKLRFKDSERRRANSSALWLGWGRSRSLGFLNEGNWSWPGL